MKIIDKTGNLKREVISVPIKGNIRVSPDAEPLTADRLIRALFGMPLDQLVKDIRENREGKYNRLYQKEESAKKHEEKEMQ